MRWGSASSIRAAEKEGRARAQHRRAAAAAFSLLCRPMAVMEERLRTVGEEEERERGEGREIMAEAVSWFTWQIETGRKRGANRVEAGGC